MISHLLFAYDTLRFSKLEENHLGYLSCILVYFKVMSEVKIKLSKRVLIPISEVLDLNNLAHFFGCGVDYLPSSYLSLPLGAIYKCKAI